MRVIQSLWTKPMEVCNSYPQLGVDSCSGELSDYLKLLHVSNYTISSVYGKSCEVVVDETGFNLLKEIEECKFLQLQTSLELSNLSLKSPQNFWSYGKILTLCSQKSGFIHFDNDILLFEKINEPDGKSVVVQNIEINFPSYDFFFQNAKSLLIDIPDFILAGLSNNVSIAVNLGVFAICDVDVLDEFYVAIDKFVRNNESTLIQYESNIVNQFIEQFSLYWFLRSKDFKIDTLIDNVDPDFAQVIRFHLAPHLDKFIHFVGNTKRNPVVRRYVHFYHEYIQSKLGILSHSSNTYFNKIPSKQNNAVNGSSLVNKVKSNDSNRDLCLSIDIDESVRRFIYEIYGHDSEYFMGCVLQFNSSRIINSSLKEGSKTLVYVNNNSDMVEFNMNSDSIDGALLLFENPLTVSEFIEHCQHRMNIQSDTLEKYIIKYLLYILLNDGLLRFVQPDEWITDQGGGAVV